MKSLSSAVIVFAGVYGITHLQMIGAGEFTMIFVCAFIALTLIGVIRFWATSAGNQPPTNQDALPYIVPAPRGNPTHHKTALPQKNNTSPLLRPETH